MRGRPTLLPPIGLRLSRTAHLVSTAFDRAMAEHGSSRAAWQVLVLVRSREWGTQAAMAEAMGIRGATLTHHLNALERQGLVRRWREDANRRVQRTELTDQGAALFDRLRAVAGAHDQRLRATLDEGEVEQLAELLDKIQAGFEDAQAPALAVAAPR